MKLSRLVCLWSLVSTEVFGTSDIQDTVYNYEKSIAYIHIQDSSISNDTIIPLPFNAKYTSGSLVNSTFSTPGNSCELISANSSLYSVCSSDSSDIELFLLNATSQKWTELQLGDSVPLFEGSSYMNTFDDPLSLYIFGGYDSDNEEISDRMLRVDLDKLTVSNFSTSVKPSSFYGASSLKINFNTELLVGGKVSSGWIGMTQLALWQYGSWAFKSVSIPEDDVINARVQPLLLPVFDSTRYQLETTSSNFSSFSVDSVMMLGGQLMGNSSNPDFVSLNMSDNSWQWTPLDTDVSLSNSRVNSKYDDNLSLDEILGAATLYDTLIVIADNAGKPVNSSQTETNTVSKRSQSYYIKLYDTSTLEALNTVDYSSLASTGKKKSSKETSKSAVIALSTIIPILVIIIAAVIGFLLYKRYKKRKEEEANEKEIKDIMEFYKSSGNQFSSSYSSLGSDITEKARASEESTLDGDAEENDVDSDIIEINNYDDNDNLSITSWRRKRKLYEKQRKTRLRSGGGSLMRHISIMSSQLGMSLRRSFSYQSSVATELSTVPDSGYQDDFSDNGLPESPIRRPSSTYSPSLKHNQSNSALYLIPEDSSVSPLRSSHRFKSPVSGTPEGSPGILPTQQLEEHRQQKELSSVARQLRFNAPSKQGSRSMSRSTSRQSRPTSRSSSRPSSPSKFWRKYDPFTQISDNKKEPDENMDVQILVSSKRRSKLRVTNPDLDDDLGDIDEFAVVKNESEARDASMEALKGETQQDSVEATASSVSDSDVRLRHVSDESKSKDESSYK
ncbi:hypothetical protein FOA43_003668 [Brettanomyces nanus]|uniref:Uncharacterized protein n=1 Tax=Eeniella nana TaxID=13502 RepID=A0A875S8S6_EENNA|nr:uncharacterized protein FOA43_003668 [Brettanomyces nanus]QPG76282.1 hypothetical protein FOA43_003668 [Brettanomyces nanus]